MDELRTILLAEDNPKDVELTLELMAENNLANHIFVVRDGVEAIEFLHSEGKYKLRKSGNPALVLLDIKMPHMDGIEVLRHIRNDSALKSIPVVILTSSREEKDLSKTYELGVSAYLLKPLDFEHFVEAVKQIGSFWAVLNELPSYSSL
jgi:CheY-like chemotaxis protein